MAPRARLCFFPPHLTLALRPARLAAFLDAHGAPLPGAEPAPRLEVARSLSGFACEPRCAEAIDLLALLGTPIGARAIADALAAAGRSRAPAFPCEDLAAWLLTRRARDPREEAVLERALHRFARFVPPSPPLELVGAKERRAADPALAIAALPAFLGERFVDGWQATDEEGRVHFVVVRRSAPRAALTYDRSAGLVQRRLRRELLVDVLRVEPDGARLVVRCDEPALERGYAELLGLTLFGDAQHFESAVAYTLKPIVALGSTGLAAARPPGVSRVRVIDLTWDDGEGTTHHVHGSDALAAFERRGGASGGYVTSALFRLDIEGAPRAVDVAVRLPDRAEYRSARHEPVARAALGSLGVLSPGRERDDSFTLAPWVHAEWRWQRTLGGASFARLVARGILVRTESRMVGAPEMGKYGWSYVSFDLKSEPGKKYAVAMDPALPSRDLGPEELRMWRLDLAALKRTLAEDFATEAVPADPALEGDALDLGLVRGRGLDLRILAVLRSPGVRRRAVAETMVRAAGAAHVVVLVPEGRSVGAGVEVPLSVGELFGDGSVARKVFASVAEKKGLAHAVVEPWRLAGADVRFVAEEKTGRMWLDRHELVLRETAARVLLATARAGGQPVRSKELAQFVSPHRSDDGVVRQTVPKIGGWIRESFEQAGRKAPEDAERIVEWVRNQGWRMTVRCLVV